MFKQYFMLTITSVEKELLVYQGVIGLEEGASIDRWYVDHMRDFGLQFKNDQLSNILIAPKVAERCLYVFEPYTKREN